MKSGLKTSEFWVAVVTALLPVVKKFFVPDLPIEMIIGLGSYIISRGIAKAGKSNNG